ncbi:winged helix DNA-binding domain-containing protein [Nocardioides dokdonensis]|uniref:winged helix DNA-binding domain-containing protein n=1 Tax=Nocardioides dokdonensis TaxID=450734 RepID=UPI000829AAFD|nr:winged helix DNA-binding domain-containing protein [Nocardioides dokdonensis]
MRHVSDHERRDRLARRHALAPSHRAPDPASATRAVVVLHATEPATVHLSLQARVDGLRVADVDRALYDDRSLVRQLAMRRTMFVFPRDLLPAAWGSAAARTAAAERARLLKDVRAAGVAADGEEWLRARQDEVRAALAAEPGGLTSLEVRARVPGLEVRINGGTVWAAGRVLGQLGAAAEIVRGPNLLHWRQSRPRWRLAQEWLGGPPTPLDAPAGYAELVRRWLHRFGPGTESDLVWWLGATKGAVRAALAEVGAVEVGTDAAEAAYLLPDDLEPEPSVAPWAALLPVLDPTVMGWKQRAFYLGEHQPVLFDRNGNAGTTAWWAGRVVGCWVQDEDGAVEVRLIEDVGAEGRAALGSEAARLTDWLEGQRVGTVYPSPAMRADPGDLAYAVVRA